MGGFLTGMGQALDIIGQISEANQRETGVNYAIGDLKNQQAASKDAELIRERERQGRLKRVLATQRAMFGGSGVDPLSGSAATLRSSSIGEAAREAVEDDLFARRAEEARQTRVDALSEQKDYIRGARDVGIGSSVVQSALRYRRI